LDICYAMLLRVSIYGNSVNRCLRKWLFVTGSLELGLDELDIHMEIQKKNIGGLFRTLYQQCLYMKVWVWENVSVVIHQSEV
jgi:hypothetical protein